jgi:hypothetical protein
MLDKHLNPKYVEFKEVLFDEKYRAAKVLHKQEIEIS